MSYISCFSGIGGLEGDDTPTVVCELDPECQMVLRKKFPSAILFSDIADVRDTTSDVIVGGWPCQDLSIAGKQQGLTGDNSRQFYSFLETALKVNASTVIAENVPNLLRLGNGDVFREVVRQFKLHGYRYCSWTTLDAQQFGLPHSRKRVFFIASGSKAHCFSLFRGLPRYDSPEKHNEAAGFYWTAGTRSIVYSEGFVPTIKVGSSLSIPSPPAVHYGNVVRQLTPEETLKLQGFEPNHLEGLKPNAKYRMAGNAVAVPVGRFVVNGVLKGIETSEISFLPKQSSLFQESEGNDVDPFSGSIPPNGFYDEDIREVVTGRENKPATNLVDFLDVHSTDRLSRRAATGLLRRLNKSGLFCPPKLKKDLEAI